MLFDAKVYLDEMKAMVDTAINRLLKERPDFEIFTASIWTDPNASSSSMSFDSKSNSDARVQDSNEWNKKYHDKYVAEGNLQQAKLFEPTTGRNCNPADFALRDYAEMNHSSMMSNWEEDTQGTCWDILEPLLLKVGEYAFSILVQLNLHPDFELSVNGRQDWYEYTWGKE